MQQKAEASDAFGLGTLWHTVLHASATEKSPGDDFCRLSALGFETKMKLIVLFGVSTCDV